MSSDNIWTHKGTFLLAAVGSLTARDLGLDVQLYDPYSHYGAVRDQFWGLGEEAEGSAYDAETPAPAAQD